MGIIRIFERIGAKIYLAAPTGRAAKEWKSPLGGRQRPSTGCWSINHPRDMRNVENNPLECDVLIIDETSMVDIILMYNLLKAVRDETIVILVGDVDQLPSVGAGNVLSDIIASGMVDVVKLTRIFRQAQNSAIITNAHRITRESFPH